MGINFFGKRERPEREFNVSDKTAAVFVAALSAISAFNISCVAMNTSGQVSETMDEQRMMNSTGLPNVPRLSLPKKEKLYNLGAAAIRKMTPETLNTFEVGDFYLLDAEQARIISENPLQFDDLEGKRKMGLLNVKGRAK